MRHFIKLILILSLSGPAILAAEPPMPLPLRATYRVNVTSQPYSFYFPWQKKNHYSRSGMGVVIGPNRILVSASLVRDHTYAELQQIKTGEKQPATVVCVDYEANLAIIKADDAGFLKDAAVLAISDNLERNATATVWQFEDDGAPLSTKGQLRRAKVNPYPHGKFLVYEINANLPSFARPQGTPVVADNKLVGLMLNYSSSNQTVRLIPPEIIRHFLEDYDDGDYQGFPKAGFGYTRLDDPQLRAFVKLPEDEEGVYVTYVQPTGSAAEAGLKKGDVLLRIDNFEIDRLGLYDDPEHGKLDLGHISTTRSTVGQTRRFTVWRDAARKELTVKLRRISPMSYPIPPYIYDRGPDYVITGGLVFIELSQQFLREWGGKWRTSAPQQLVHYDRNQWELFKPGKKLVILGQILKTPHNGGYKDLTFHVLTEVNGKAIKRLGDIPPALKTPAREGFHSFSFDQSMARRIILDANQLNRDNQGLKRHVGELQRLTGDNLAD